jgi:hypothetical protein
VRDQNFNWTQLLPHLAKSCRDLLCIGDIYRNWENLRSKLSGKFSDELSRAREHSHATAFSDEFPHERCAEPGAYSGDNCHGLMRLVGHTLLGELFRRLRPALGNLAIGQSPLTLPAEWQREEFA